MGYDYFKSFLNNGSIKFKEHKLDFLKKLAAEEESGTDKTNLAYDVFEQISLCEHRFNKPVEMFNLEEFNELFECFDTIKQIKVYMVLSNYFDFMGANKKHFSKVRVRSHEEMTIVTFSEFKKIIKDILEKEDIDGGYYYNRYYVCSVLIMLYYGLDIMDLPKFKFKDLETTDKLLGEVDALFYPILDRSSKQTSYIAKNNKGKPTFFEYDEDDVGVICKSRTIYNDRKHLNLSYYRIVKPYLDACKPEFNLTLKRVSLSGALHFAVKECIKRGLNVQQDFLYRKNKTFSVYLEIMKKHGLSYYGVRSNDEWLYSLLKEADEQLRN